MDLSDGDSEPDDTTVVFLQVNMRASYTYEVDLNERRFGMSHILAQLYYGNLKSTL